MKAVSILGSTGSVGRQALEVIERFPDRFKVTSLSAGSNTGLLTEQMKKFSPSAVCVGTKEQAREVEAAAGGKTRVLCGREGLLEIARDESDTALCAIVGGAGLAPTLAAVRAGKRVALANKEAVVAAGGLIMDEARRSGAEIAPVDSEHSAVFQSLRAGGAARRIVITASGGPFRNFSEERLRNVTARDALRHPTWEMGEKITVDSATMMNKAFEIIEARWLFDIPPEKISVWIHPQSVVHSIVEFEDGSSVCQMSEPDMRVPIAYALSFPERLPLGSPTVTPERMGELSFEEADTGKTAALALGFEALRAGGTAPAAMSAANEEAVRLFLENRIKFTDIVEVAAAVTRAHKPLPADGLEVVEEAARRAAEQARSVASELRQ